MKIFQNFLIVLLFCPILLTTACSEPEPTASAPKKKWIAAVDTTFIPMAFINDRNEKDGFEVDLIHAIAEEAGHEVEIIDVEWGGLFGGLITGKFDMLISSITILEERKKKFAFSIPYLESGVALLARKDLGEISGLEDLESKDGLAGAQINTTSYFYLNQFEKVPQKAYEKIGHALIDLINGGIVAVLGDTTQINYFYNQNEELRQISHIVGQRLTSESYGIVFRQDSAELIHTVNSAITALVEKGRLKELHDKWNLGEFATVPTPQSKTK
ncbi:MAG: transporter substrate-binding domain-containing protein [Candidatus Nitrohelix vancouverensis]|uniref:Transporter substrate-binding domain-containing protein n=1 Tax=Candidatus Nitrohelix vancouverensis TaxID=2705534 RepID=A0A7T0C0P4_9BACT|nr:MAG: transporter substrate-binding domain-containing protein [Candidatus Nitrohelix vancouverensis]